jgi:DNA-binding response OmpR family regulator
MYLAEACCPGCLLPEGDMAYCILHLEDDPHLARLVQIGFQHLGFSGEVLSAATVRQALTILQDRLTAGQPVDLILVDVELPDGSGLDVIRRVKANPAWVAIPVVVLSNNVDPEDVTEAYVLGANCYLSKLAAGKGIMGAVESLYRCWFEQALLPIRVPAASGLEILGRAIALKARASQFYLCLAEAFPGDEEAVQFWLDLALNESNHANLLGFFRSHAREAQHGADADERYLVYGSRREAAMEAAEKSLAREPRPSATSAIQWAVDLESSVNGSLLVEGLALFFPKGPVAARAFRDGMSGHLRRLGELALRRAPDARARERAEALLSMARQIKSSLSTP